MIPKIIHKVIIVDGDAIPPLPDKMVEAIDSFKVHNPTYQHKLYSGKDCIAYIRKYFDDRILNCFLKLKPYSYRADLFRYLVLYNEGGWYSDSKQVCYNNFDIFDKDFVVSLDAHINPNCLFTAFIGSVRGHPILKKTIDIVLFNIEHEHYGLNCLYVTGPGVFMQGAIDFLRRHGDKCIVGKHIIDNMHQSFICFGKHKLIKHKYNSPRVGGIYSDIPGGNNYGDMWKIYDIYNHS